MPRRTIAGRIALVDSVLTNVHVAIQRTLAGNPNGPSLGLFFRVSVKRQRVQNELYLRVSLDTLIVLQRSLAEPSVEVLFQTYLHPQPDVV